MEIHVAVVLASKGPRAGVGAETLVKEHGARLEADGMVPAFVIDEIKGPRLGRPIGHMHDAADHVGVDAVPVHMQH